MITIVKVGKTHVNYIDSDAPKDSNCLGTMRVEFADCCLAAMEKQRAESMAPIANRDDTTNFNEEKR